jgi:diguanylate cyclase (GGDEF)-like protein
MTLLASPAPPSIARAPAGGERLVDRLADFLARISPTGEIHFVSGPGTEWLGYPAGFFKQGDALSSIVAADDHGILRESLRLASLQGRQALSARLIRCDGAEASVTCRILNLVVAGDHAELLFAAWEAGGGRSPDAGCAAPESPPDTVTGLPTRSRLPGKLAELIRPGVASDSGFALLHLDLDGFQKVNDALGHAVGDRLLAEAAERLVSLLRSSDSVIRSGSDEFALILPGCHGLDAVLPVARKVLSAMQRPYLLGESRLHLSASIGIALYPEHAQDGEQLFRCADIALSAAKHEGRNRWSVYFPEGGVESNRRVVLEEHMYDAIQNGEFEMHYQPICRAESREIVGVEALMRWHRPGEGYISPMEFIPLAERNGLIGFLGAWSLRASCHQVAQWNSAWGVRMRASVNISPAQFRQGDIVAKVHEALVESGLPAECLSLEITEGTLMHDPGETEALLNGLRQLGLSIAVDDFGTGYSSLAYLKRFPLSTLKIDRSFVRDLDRDANDLAIVSAILGLAKELGLKVVAEGVETERQLAILAGKGCDLIQGYLLGRPISAEQMGDNVGRGEWRVAK